MSDLTTLLNQALWTKNQQDHHTIWRSQWTECLERDLLQPRCLEPPTKTPTSLGTKTQLTLLFSNRNQRQRANKGQDIMQLSHQECSPNKVGQMIRKDLLPDRGKKTNG